MVKMKRVGMDMYLLVSILILMILGLVMVFSASSIELLMKGSSPYQIFYKQGKFVVIGIGIMFATAYFDFRIWKKIAPIMYFISIIFLMLIFVPGLGVESNNALRWLKLGPLPMQPSEIVKITMILMMAKQLSNKKEKELETLKCFMTSAVYIAIPVILTLMQPSFTSGITILLIGASVLMASGTKMRYFAFSAAAVSPLLYFYVISHTYMVGRLNASLDRWSVSQGGGFQSIQSLYALANGGLFGVGLGSSTQKYQYIPEAQNDFIFAIIGEELGLVGATLVIGLFSFLIVRGIRASLNCPDAFGRITAFGITFMIGFQAIFNILVAVGVAPTTGIALPLFSAGGTSYLMVSFALGILLSISRYQKA